MKFINNYIDEAKIILENLDKKLLELLINGIYKIKKDKGRIFFIGVGGSAANCSHAVNDFRKICGIESYAITDNISELTARTNDDGWSSIFVEWLKTSKMRKKDALFILSVGGGNYNKNVSPNIIEAIKYAKTKKIKIYGITGKKIGYTQKNADVCVVVPNVNEVNLTPHSESFQSVILHLIVSHPKIKKFKTKW
jgi:D-sedoheptulose 7-phosphate isomerase